MGNSLGYAGGYEPVDVGSIGFSMGTPAMAPMGTTSNYAAPAPTTQSATAAVVGASNTSGGVQAPGSDVTGGAAAQFNPITGEQLNPGFFQKGGGLQIGLGALQTLGNLWNSFQQIKLAKEQFSFQKDAWRTNLANQEKSYNTSLENRARSANTFNGTDKATTDTYIKEHSL